jgi:hypothetical protein
MIRLKTILSEIDTIETNEDMTQYVIDGDKRAVVGVKHGSPPTIRNAKDFEKIKSIGDEYGYWYEGGGGDKEVVKRVFGNIKYEGSWDDKIAKNKVANPHIFVFTMFSNTAENGTVKKVQRAKGNTIYEKACNSYKEWAHEMIKGKSKGTVSALIDKFFKKLGRDYYNDANQPNISDKDVQIFIESVEADMWDGWPNGTGPAFEMAYEANFQRDRDCLKTIKSGVIFIGDGHLDGPVFKKLGRIKK